MRRAPIRTILLLALAAPLALPGQGTPPATPAVVSTAASATHYVRPDLATFTVQVTEDGLSAREAGQRIAARVDSIRRALATLRIPRDSIISARRSDSWRGRIEVIATSGCRPRRERGPDGRTCDPFADSTFRARDVLEVRVHDLEVLGAAIDTLTARGLTEIGTVRYAARSTIEAEEGALREATERARRHAEAIARAGGARLGRVLGLSTQGPERRDPFGVAATADLGTRETIPSTTIVRPWIAVTMSVQGRWELVQD